MALPVIEESSYLSAGESQVELCLSKCPFLSAVPRDAARRGHLAVQHRRERGRPLQGQGARQGGRALQGRPQEHHLHLLEPICE